MTLATLIRRNLWRNKTRTILTAGSLAFSLFLFTILSAAVNCMNSVATEAAEKLRLVVHHKSTVTKLLPMGHGPKLAGLTGVEAVCAMRWFGGRLENSREQFPSMAVDEDTFPIVFDDFQLGEDELSVWHRRRTAAVLGVGLAERIGCRTGDRVVLFGSVPPYLKLDFDVAGVTRAGAYPNVFVFRLDYLVDALRADPMMPFEHDESVNIFWVRAASRDALNSLRKEIDARFVNSGDETRTELETIFAAHFTRMFGDVPGIIRGVSGIVIASILLVVCNTMCASVRERIGELALFKAMGFPTLRLAQMIAGEAIVIGMLGSIGCAAALCLFGLSRVALNIPYFPIITVTPTIALFGLAVSLAVSAAAAAVPAVQIARFSVTATLRSVG